MDAGPLGHLAGESGPPASFLGRRRLMTVLVTIFSLLLATSMALFTYRVLQQDVQHNITTLEQQDAVLASNLAATAAEPLLERDYTGIEQLLLRAIQFPGIDEIQVADATGKVLSDVVLDNHRGLARFGLPALTLPGTASVHVEMHTDRMVTWHPVFLGNLLGWIRVTQSLAGVAAMKRHIWSTNAVFGAVLLISTIVTVLLILRKPMHSLGRYADFADQLGERSGEQVRVCATSRELESLGQALNRASTRLYEQNVTIQKGVEELERLAAFPERSPDIVLSLDSAGALQYLNPYGRGLLSELGLGDDGIRMLLPCDYETLIAKCRDEGSAARDIEAEHGGRTFLWTLSPIVKRDLVHCYGSEITAHKEAQEQARQALIEKQVAEVASEAKSMFLANMSHEIRTPLTAIIGFSEAMLNVNLSVAERIEGIRTVHRAGKHLLNIINDILDLSKIEAGRLEVECVSVVLFDVVDDVVTLARLQAEAKGIEFIVEPVFPLPEKVHSDPVRIRQILLNLIGNAVKFTEKGVVTLWIRYEAARRELSLEVKDTGVGISQEQLSHMFTPFSQADASITRRFGGTGLGLALSKDLAEMLGGTITAKSTPGLGSCFTFTLKASPMGATLNGLDDVQRAQRLLGSEEGAEVLSGSVLLAEDNPDNQRLISFIARSVGIDIAVVDNGEMAVQAARQRTFDLVLMDMQMPVMDGLTAAAALRADGYRGPIVALTANASTQDRQNCLGAGCDAFLTKPIERSRFCETLRRYLESSPEDVQGKGPQPQSVIPPMLDRDPGLTGLMQYFLVRIVACYKDLELATAEEDIEEVRKQARNIKAMGSDYMFPQVMEIAEQLDLVATAGHRRAAQDVIAQLGVMIERIEVALQEADGQGDTSVDDSPIVSELVQEGPEMAELVPYFLERLPAHIDCLREAHAGGDWIRLKKKVHDLKAIGGGYGYPMITELAVRLETALEASPDQAGELIEALARMASRIEAGAGQTVIPRAEAAE